MPYALIFAANEVGNLKNVCHMREYAYIEVCLMRGSIVVPLSSLSTMRCKWLDSLMVCSSGKVFELVKC